MLVCAAIVGACAVALAIGALVTRTERMVTGVVRGSLNGVSLDLGDANVEIIRGGNRESVELERTERFTFDHGPVVERRIAGSTPAAAVALSRHAPAHLLGGLPPDRARQRARPGQDRVGRRALRGLPRLAST